MLPSFQLLGPRQPVRTTLLCPGNLLAPVAVAVAEQGLLALRTRLRCAGNLLAPIALAVAEQGLLAVWARRKAAQQRVVRVTCPDPKP